jgi:uncharacterized protein with GYD domain
MATYVSTVKFTSQGIKAIAETTKRAAGLKDAATKMGVNVKDIYWTLGAFDGLLIFDAPDEQSATAFLLHVGSQGNVETSSGRAFSAEETDQILSRMSGS